MGRLRVKYRLARRLRMWANLLDPKSKPESVVVGIASRDFKAGQFIHPGDILTHGAIVVQQPQSEINVVHSSIGTQAARVRKRNSETVWKNRR